MEVRAPESESVVLPQVRSGDSKPMGTIRDGERLKEAPALTSLQLGEVILPQEAAGHEHREHKEKAAGSW